MPLIKKRCPKCGSVLWSMPKVAKTLGLKKAWTCSNMNCNYTESK